MKTVNAIKERNTVESITDQFRKLQAIRRFDPVSNQKHADKASEDLGVPPWMPKDDLRAGITDAIANLLHLAHENKMNVGLVVQGALNHFIQETEGLP